eukprot:gene16431-7840_t
MADDKPKKLPWGLKPESLAPSSMKGLPESKLKAFQMGRNPLKGKAPSKLKEEEKKKAEEAATAEVYAEYIESFQESASVGKTFVRANIINADEEINEKTNHKYHKNTSKLAELAEEFKKHKDQSVAQKVDLKKKKEKEKKKSNLELFKEELERSQKEREIRHKIKKGEFSGIPDDVLKNLPTSFFKTGSTSSGCGGSRGDWPPPKFDDDNDTQSGSMDNGDPNTTNLYIGNINPKMTEEQLCKLFGQYGPLASVKIMWPRTDEEKARNRNCGFVAYMNRGDGEKALRDLMGKDIMGFDMRLGWGKSVPIPPQPIYVPPEMIEAQKPPPPSGLPFNAQLSAKLGRDGKQFDGKLENTIVKVVIPMERSQLAVIHRMVEFVAREGPMFEAMIMNKELNNPMFRFLFDNKGHEHIYYRWRLFSILQGDTPQKWSQVEFRMFDGGSIWRPPPMNPYAVSTVSQTSQALAAVSSAIVASNIILPKQEKTEPAQEITKKQLLTDSQRDKLEDLLRTVTSDRRKVGELMVWSLDHADFADEIVECITESLSLLETPIPTKIARLYVVSDILHNSSAKIHHASHFRRGFENKLSEVMEHLRSALVSASSKSTAEKFRKQVLSCLAAWQDWSLYPPGFLIKLQNTFVGLSDKKKDEIDGFPLAKDQDIDGHPVGKDDVDGIPIDDQDNNLDGFPLSKGAEVDIDGIPFGGDIDGAPTGKMKASRWEPVDPDSPLRKSKWAKEESDDPDMPKSKWEREDDGGSKNKWNVEDSANSKWQRVTGSPKERHSNEDSRSSAHDSPAVHVGEVDEPRRKLLREVELKVMRYADKLEANGMSKSSSSFQYQLEKYRQGLIEEHEKERRKRGKDRKRDRSLSSSPNATPIRNAQSPRKKRSHRSRSRSRSISDESSEDERDVSRSSRKHKSKRSRSGSTSPTTPKRSSSSKKKRKKSKK